MRAVKGTGFRYELREAEKSGVPAYELEITNTRQTPGRYFDRLVLTTDRRGHSPISIIVSGRIRK